MKILLDTNIVIHREASKGVSEDIGTLFRWIDNLHYDKYIHPDTVAEIHKYNNPQAKLGLRIKLENYNVLRTTAPVGTEVASISQKYDRTANDIIDTGLLNEVFSGRVDFLVSEDRKIAQKAQELNISNRVFSINSFLEKMVSENPDLVDYRVLSVKKEYFGNINLNDKFFDSFREDYEGFDRWFTKKSQETAYVAKNGDSIIAFLYVKVEKEDEPYNDISPAFARKRRLKIGTFKVVLNGFRLGERFLKIIFDNAINYSVDEIYVTIFDQSLEQKRLIDLFRDYGFQDWGVKESSSGKEAVYVRNFVRKSMRSTPKITYPFLSSETNVFLVSIYPEYHTNLLPDSILRTESPADFVDMTPSRNAISKVFISRSYEKRLTSGDVIIFYRTGGRYKSVITTIGIVESVVDGINSAPEFIETCRKRSVFTDKELIDHWNYYPNLRPFIVNFLFVYSFPKKINLDKLIELGVIKDIESAPRGFVKISKENFIDIIRETSTDKRYIV